MAIAKPKFLNPEITHYYTGLTMELWQKSPQRVSWARDLIQHQHFKELLSMIQNEVPIPDLKNTERAALDAATVVGYLSCANMLIRMTQRLGKLNEEPEPTYPEPKESEEVLELQ